MSPPWLRRRAAQGGAHRPEFPATNGQLVKQPIEWPVGAVRQLGLDIPGTTGWLGRWLDAAGGDPRLAVSFEPVLPPLLAGAKSAGATVPGGSVKPPASVTPALLKQLGTPSAGESPAPARASTCFADLMRVQGGFDLHADEKTAQEAVLARLGRPLSKFVERMAAQGVVVGWTGRLAI